MGTAWHLPGLSERTTATFVSARRAAARSFLEDLCELGTRLFYMGTGQALRLPCPAGGPRRIERAMFPVRAPHPPGDEQVEAHIALRQRVQAIEHLGRDRLQTGHDEGQVETAVAIARDAQIPGGERR